jgi:hypothetical protein
MVSNSPLSGSSGTLINDKIIISKEYNKELETARNAIKRKNT